MAASTFQNLFTAAFQTKRSSSAIYNGPDMPDLGLKHQSAISRRYISGPCVAKDIVLAQSIAEGVSLAMYMLKTIERHAIKKRSDQLISCRICIPEEYHTRQVVPSNIHHYNVKLDLLTNEIAVGAFTYANKFIPDCNNKATASNQSGFFFSTLYKLLPIMATYCLLHRSNDSQYKDAFDNYIKEASHLSQEEACEIFGYLCDELLHNYKDQDTVVVYKNVGVRKEPAKATIQPSEIPFFLPECFPVTHLSYIPKLGKEFQLPNLEAAYVPAVFNGDAKAILFYGPAGTGKTALVKLYCQAMQLPLMEVINCSSGMTDTILGKYIPVEEKIIFRESNIVEAVRNGGAVAFEEINFSKPEHMAFLNSLLDDNGFILLDNGEKVKRHPNFRFFATMNVGYAGTRDLNDALYNRFQLIAEIPDLPEVAIRNMLISRVPECAPYIQQIIEVYRKIKKHIQQSEFSSATISPRNLESWVSIAKYVGYEQAAERTIIQCAKFDKDNENAFRRIIESYNWKRYA